MSAKKKPDADFAEKNVAHTEIGVDLGSPAGDVTRTSEVVPRETEPKYLTTAELLYLNVQSLVSAFRNSPEVMWLDASALIGKAIAGRISKEEAGERVVRLL